MQLSERVGCYGGKVYIVADAARAELKDKFRETGYAFGATLPLLHPDWQAVANHALGPVRRGRALVHCESESGELSGIGSIVRGPDGVTFEG